jgi:Tol biopolymer transport system component
MVGNVEMQRTWFVRSAIMVCSLALSLVSAASFAADRVLMTRSNVPTKAVIHIAEADGRGEHPLLGSDSLDYNPAWSPRGDWIAFTSERDGSADLYRVHPDGTGLERLTRNPAFDDQAAFSPDEQRLVFVSTRAAGYANLWILDLATGKARPLTSGRGGDFRPAWSPDGRWIAFSSDRKSDLPSAKGRWERLHVVDIYVVHPDGTGLKRLTSNKGDACGSPKWSADSNRVVAYCMTAQDTWTNRAGQGDTDDVLETIDIRTGAVTALPSAQGAKTMPALLPSGEVGYLRRDATASGIFYSGGASGPAGADVRGPSWSPDGKHVVFSRFDSSRGAWPTRLWSRDPNFELYAVPFLPAVDAPRLRFATTIPGKLYVAEDGKAPRLILERPDLIMAPQWSADGRQIVVGVGRFSAFLDFTIGDKKPADPVNGGGQTAVLNADGSDFHLVTSGPNNNAFASFAPDGRRLVYRTEGPEGQGLRILDLTDKSVKPLTRDWDNFPIWSPRGDRIAFVRRLDNDFQVFTIRPDGTGLRQLTRGSGNNAHLAWSPDGLSLLFTSSIKGFKDEAQYTEAPQPYGEIFMMRADGSGLRQLTDNQWEDGGPAWLPAAPHLDPASPNVKGD